MLYILVTAAPPFDGADDKEIMESVRKLQYSFDSIFLITQSLRLNTYPLR